MATYKYCCLSGRQADVWNKFEISPGNRMSGLSAHLLSNPSLLGCLLACIDDDCLYANYNQLSLSCEIGSWKGSDISGKGTVEDVASYKRVLP